MVLDEASLPDAAMDSSPPSDSDMYSADGSTSTQTRLHYNVPLQHLKKPYFSMGKRSLESTIIVTNRVLDEYAHIIHRPLTTEEATAIAELYSKQLRTTLLGIPLGFLGGNYRAYSTRKSLKFPFWPATNPPKMNPEKFPGMSSAVLSRLTWTALRHSAYSIAGTIIGMTFFSFYASNVRVVTESADPRLKSVLESRRAYVKARSGNAPSNSVTPGAGQGHDSEGEDASELWKSHRTSIGADDGASLQNSNMISDQQIADQEAQRSTAARNSQNTSRVSAWTKHQRPQPDADSRGELFEFDDASPTARYSDSSDQGTESTGGSAWDRVRRSNRSSPPSKTTPTARSGNPSRDSWSNSKSGSNQQTNDYAFSNSETDQQLAKEEAQRSFDQRVERERQGGDFGGNEKGGRWS